MRTHRLCMLFDRTAIMKNFLILTILVFGSVLFGQQSEPALKKIDFNEFQSIVNQQDDVLYVVNFWATWCRPCIEEIPGFMEVNRKFADNPKFKMVLISLDYKNLLDTRVKKFVRKHNIITDVYLLDDEKSTLELLPEIDLDWNGAIPSTAFYKNGQKLLFHQGFMNQYELEDTVDDLM